MKRRLAECFQPDSITRQIEGKKRIQEEINAAISKLKSLDPSFVMRNNVFLKEDQALLLLSATMGLHGVVILKLALDHVPPTLSKTDNARIKCSDSVFIRLGHYVHDWFSIVAR